MADSADSLAEELRQLRAEVADLHREAAELRLALQVERVRAARSLPNLAPPGRSVGTKLLAAPEAARRCRDDWAGRLAPIRPRLAAALDITPAERAAQARFDALPVWLEATLLAAVLVVAVLLRFYHLSTIPPGVQGDEASIGIEARRILHQGWIGPYSGIAAGSPTGFFYLVALSFHWFGDSILSVRLVSAFLGALGIPALWLLGRRAFGPRPALIAAALLTVLSWHIQYSRIAFPNIGWLLLATLSVAALAEAWRGGRHAWAWHGLAGALLGLGIYTYNGHVLFLGLALPFILWRLYGWAPVVALAGLAILAARPGLPGLILAAGGILLLLGSRRLRERERFVQASAFGLAFAVVALPMARFAANPASNYFAYGQRLSIFNTDDWKTLGGPAAKVSYLADRYQQFWRQLCCNPRFDGVDATGITPLVPRSMVALAALGLVLALRRRRGPIVWLGLLILLALPLASVSSVDFAMRRSMGIVPFLILFAALGAVEAVRLAGRRSAWPALGVGVLVVALAGQGVHQTLHDFFGVTANSPLTRWVMAVDIVEASKYIRDLPPDSYIYFAADRWTFNYEIRRYYAPNARGEDRSSQFGHHSWAIDPSKGRPVIVLVGQYLTDLPVVQALYPGGQVINHIDQNGDGFIAYLPLAVAAGATPPPAATPIPGTGRG